MPMPRNGSPAAISTSTSSGRSSGRAARIMPLSSHPPQLTARARSSPLPAPATSPAAPGANSPRGPRARSHTSARATLPTRHASSTSATSVARGRQVGERLQVGVARPAHQRVVGGHAVPEVQEPQRHQHRRERVRHHRVAPVVEPRARREDVARVQVVVVDARRHRRLRQPRAPLVEPWPQPGDPVERRAVAGRAVRGDEAGRHGERLVEPGRHRGRAHVRQAHTPAERPHATPGPAGAGRSEGRTPARRVEASSGRVGPPSGSSSHPRATSTASGTGTRSGTTSPSSSYSATSNTVPGPGALSHTGPAVVGAVSTVPHARSRAARTAAVRVAPAAASRESSQAVAPAGTPLTCAPAGRVPPAPRRAARARHRSPHWRAGSSVIAANALSSSRAPSTGDSESATAIAPPTLSRARSADAAGSPDTVTPPEYSAVPTMPTIATPSASPSSPAVEDSAPADPARSGGADCIASTAHSPAIGPSPRFATTSPVDQQAQPATGDLGQQQETDGRHHEPAADRHGRRHDPRQLRRRAASRTTMATVDGSSHSPGRGGGEPRDRLQVHRHEQLVRPDQPGEHGHRERRGERAVAEQPQVQQRRVEPPLPGDERDRAPDTGQHGQHRHHAEPVAGQRLQPVHERQDRGQRQRDARQVEPAGRGVALLGQHPRAEDEQQAHHRHAHQEHRAPPEVLQQHAADHRAERGAAHEAAHPDGDRLRVLARVR